MGVLKHCEINWYDYHSFLGAYSVGGLENGNSHLVDDKFKVSSCGTCDIILLNNTIHLWWYFQYMWWAHIDYDCDLRLHFFMWNMIKQYESQNYLKYKLFYATISCDVLQIKLYYHIKCL